MCLRYGSLLNGSPLNGSLPTWVAPDPLPSTLKNLDWLNIYKGGLVTWRWSANASPTAIHNKSKSTAATMTPLLAPIAHKAARNGTIATNGGSCAVNALN